MNELNRATKERNAGISMMSVSQTGTFKVTLCLSCVYCVFLPNFCAIYSLMASAVVCRMKCHFHLSLISA